MIITLNSNLNRNTVTVRSRKAIAAKFLSSAKEAQIQLTSSSETANSNILYLGSSSVTKEAYFKNGNNKLASLLSFILYL